MRIITLPDPIKNETDMIQEFLAYPDVIIHIRKPTMNLTQMNAFIAGFSLEQKKRLVLHQHQEQAYTMGLERIHYPSGQRKDFPSSSDLRYYRISTSTHSWTEFNNLNEGYDDALISPVFSSISKQGYEANKDLLHSDKRSNFSTHLIALGGISRHNMMSIRPFFNDLALCGSIWLAPDPIREFDICYELWHR